MRFGDRMKLPKKYDDVIEVVYYGKDDGYWIYTGKGWCIDFSGEKAHTIKAGNTQKEVREFLADYPIVEDADFDPDM